MLPVKALPVAVEVTYNGRKTTATVSENDGGLKCLRLQYNPKSGDDRVVCDEFHMKQFVGYVNRVESNRLRRSLCLKRARTRGSGAPDDNVIIMYFVTRILKHSVWRLKRVRLRFDNGTDVKLWECALDKVLQTAPRPRRLLVYVNPICGDKKGVRIFETRVKLVFELAHIDVDWIVTESADHAMNDVLTRDDLHAFCGVVVLGGDGFYTEILAGLVRREQRRGGVDVNDRHAALSRVATRIGIIPTGSANAIVWTVHGNDDVLTAALHIVTGEDRGLDVFGVYDDRRLLRYGSSIAAFGYLGAAFKRSEAMRLFGSCRYKLAGPIQWLRLKTYWGRLRMHLALSDDMPDVKTMCAKLKNGDGARCKVGCAVCAAPRSNFRTELCTVTNRFSHVVGNITRNITNLSPFGVSPSAHFGDGTMDVIIAARISRWQYVDVGAALYRGAGDHLTRGFVHIYRVTGFTYTPYSALSEEELKESHFGRKLPPTISDKRRRDPGFWKLDNVLAQPPDQSVHFKVHRQLVRLFTRGIELE